MGDCFTPWPSATHPHFGGLRISVSPTLTLHCTVNTSAEAVWRNGHFDWDRTRSVDHCGFDVLELIRSESEVLAAGTALCLCVSCGFLTNDCAGMRVPAYFPVRLRYKRKEEHAIRATPIIIASYLHGYCFSNRTSMDPSKRFRYAGHFLPAWASVHIARRT